MNHESETKEQRILRQLTKDLARRSLTIIAISLPIYILFLGFIQVELLNSSAGSLYSQQINDPLRWLPEFTIGFGVILNAIAGLTVVKFIRRAVTYYRLYMISVILIIAIFLDGGLRLSFTGLGQDGKYWILAGYIIGLLALSVVIGQTRAKMVVARKNGWLRPNFHEGNWTWHLSAVQRVDLDPPEEVREKKNILKKINKLHWIAPAVGMYLARNFSEEKVNLFFGLIFIFISLILTHGLFTDFGIVQQLRAWEVEKGKPLLLREVWQEMNADGTES